MSGLAGGTGAQGKYRFASGYSQPLENLPLSGSGYGLFQFLQPCNTGSVSNIFENPAWI